MSTIIFLLICYGACNNLIYGSVFERFRNTLAKFGTGGYSLHKLFTCFMCLGTWMGFVISAIALLAGVALPITVISMPLSIFLHGLLAAGGVWFIHTTQEALERHYTK